VGVTLGGALGRRVETCSIQSFLGSAHISWSQLEHQPSSVRFIPFKKGMITG
jgi:hypothetical protein